MKLELTWAMACFLNGYMTAKTGQLHTENDGYSEGNSIDSEAFTDIKDVLENKSLWK
jgi:hypothetical protein